MSRPSNQEWERTKWYLARSMIDKTAMLSPIPEAQEPSLDPLSAAEAAGGGTLSPLPDLIIEKEPNKHDEPEEYYDFLEKKFVKYYRHLFYEFSDHEESDSSAESNKSEDIKSKQSTSKSDTEEVLKVPSNNSTTSIQSVRQSNARSRETESSIRTSDISTHLEAIDNVIVTRAQIHRDIREDTSDYSRPGPSDASASGRDHSGSADAAALSDADDNNKQCDNDDVETEIEDSEACDSEAESDDENSNNDEESIRPEELEIMRKRQSTNDILCDSHGDLNVRKYSSADFAEGDERVVFDREMEEAQDPAPIPDGVVEESNFEGGAELDLMESDDGQAATSDKDEESDSTYEPQIKRRRKNPNDSLEASDVNIERRSLGDPKTGESENMSSREEREQIPNNSSRAERAAPPTLSSYEKFIQNKLDNLRRHITEGTIRLCFCRDHVCRR